jgi:prephenate dehydrogenase
VARVTIVGLGLIGGSLGLALKRAQLRDIEIVGFDKSFEAGNKAKRREAIDRVAPDLGSAVGDAAMVIVATPILAIREVLEEAAPHLREGCLVTDTGSTKAEVLKWADELLPEHVNFVGGHPMAGKEKSGIDEAEADLFVDRPYCIVPSVKADERSINTVVGLVQLVGARPVFIDAEEHDSYTAAVSHLPIMLSACLFSLAKGSEAWPELANLASSGFRDLTRLASGDPEMAHDISLTNRDSVVHWIDRMIAELRRYRDLIQDDQEELFKVLARAQMDRDTFLQTPKVTRPEPVEAEVASAGERMAALLVGEHWVRRAKEITKALDQQAAEKEKGRRLRRK